MQNKNTEVNKDLLHHITEKEAHLLKVVKDQRRKTRNTNKRKIKNIKKINIDLVRVILVLLPNKNEDKNTKIKIDQGKDLVTTKETEIMLKNNM